ncbi:RluB [Acetoanaerobium sticklandii]|uniref:Pseudouridine synthase n=1 Tax=Acetoanaerobium sticklandii (strain ATCC 12662 / DSM 519 / JCM 1433 / CCUG 9281 / NCIMB 10654 / HF) TaxID=499177 RepID=E3PRU3_ACESD|nr:pseudouridine synthase [Acetoanaerobium sticklandii]CBH21597.1 RluB [Acetoanaerobium sticklandii]
MRINKFIASCGIASRRKAEEMIQEGRVRINDSVVSDLSTKVSEIDIVKIDGKIISKVEEKYYYMLNKPIGYVSTAKDQFGRPSVVDFFDKKQRIYPVGRLDYDSRGLLLMTNDGDLTYALTHPKYHIEKIYEVIVSSTLSNSEIEKFKSGIDIGGYVTAKSRITFIGNTSYEVIIKEGKNRQIRKMFSALGKDVLDLKRVSIGKLKLMDLKEGTYRKLINEEVEYLKKICELKGE